MNRAHLLEEVVEAGWAPSVVYLQKRLRRGEIPGSKVGRHWVMDDADIAEYREMTRNRAAQDVPRRIGLSSASMRRRSA